MLVGQNPEACEAYLSKKPFIEISPETETELARKTKNKKQKTSKCL